MALVEHLNHETFLSDIKAFAFIYYQNTNLFFQNKNKIKFFDIWSFFPKWNNNFIDKKNITCKNKVEE